MRPSDKRLTPMMVDGYCASRELVEAFGVAPFSRVVFGLIPESGHVRIDGQGVHLQRADGSGWIGTPCEVPTIDSALDRLPDGWKLNIRKAQNGIWVARLNSENGSSIAAGDPSPGVAVDQVVSALLSELERNPSFQ